MVAPSKELVHPFSGRKPKTLAAFPKANTNANTAAEKPKGPFSNLLTATSMIKKYDEHKRGIKKSGESNRRDSESQLSERVSSMVSLAFIDVCHFLLPYQQIISWIYLLPKSCQSSRF